MTFEQALNRLKEISEEMDKPELTLQHAVELYAEASELEAVCERELSAAKLSLERVDGNA